jgi:hypothetical protein
MNIIPTKAEYAEAVKVKPAVAAFQSRGDPLVASVIATIAEAMRRGETGTHVDSTIPEGVQTLIREAFATEGWQLLFIHQPQPMTSCGISWFE